MNPLDIIIDRTLAEQKTFVEKARREIAPYGYSIVLTSWLRTTVAPVKAKSRRLEAMAKVPLVDRLKTMLVD